MRPNETKRKLASGRPALGLFVSSASPLTAETAGGLGFDWVLIDLQHGENDLGNLSGMLTALGTTPATPFVRVPENDSMHIQRALDLGAYGVVVPMVNTPADAEAVVQAVRYAPRGARSWGPIRGLLYGGPDYLVGAAEELMAFAMLETAQAIGNAREVLSVDGIDGCFVGLNDLSISLGVSNEAVAGETLAPAVEDALMAILDACRTTGKVPGVQLYGPGAINRRLRQGFRFIGAGTELRVLRDAALGILGAIER